MPNNNATRRNYLRTAYNKSSNKNYYNYVMRVRNPNSTIVYVANTTKPNKKYTAFKSGRSRYVLTADGFLFRLAPGSNIKRINNKSQLVANLLHGSRN